MPYCQRGLVSKAFMNLIWFDFCFMALQHILGHFERGQLP